MKEHSVYFHGGFDRGTVKVVIQFKDGTTHTLNDVFSFNDNRNGLVFYSMPQSDENIYSPDKEVQFYSIWMENG